MSAFTGRQYKGAARDHRKTKREDAEARSAALQMRLPCGHNTSLSIAAHTARCEVSA